MNSNNKHIKILDLILITDNRTKNITYNTNQSNR